jgi:hypothetical protein
MFLKIFRLFLIYGGNEIRVFYIRAIQKALIFQLCWQKESYIWELFPALDGKCTVFLCRKVFFKFRSLREELILEHVPNNFLLFVTFFA